MTLQPLITDIYYTSIKSFFREEQKVYSQYVPQTHIRGVTKDLKIELRVNIEKQPILNNEMEILNYGMDWQDPSAPN